VTKLSSEISLTMGILNLKCFILIAVRFENKNQSTKQETGKIRYGCSQSSAKHS
jgi:hypothetical protein